MGADWDPKATSDTVILALGSHKGDKTGIGETLYMQIKIIFIL